MTNYRDTLIPADFAFDETRTDLTSTSSENDKSRARKCIDPRYRGKGISRTNKAVSRIARSAFASRFSSSVPLAPSRAAASGRGTESTTRKERGSRTARRRERLMSKKAEGKKKKGEKETNSRRTRRRVKKVGEREDDDLASTEFGNEILRVTFPEIRVTQNRRRRRAAAPLSRPYKGAERVYSRRDARVTSAPIHRLTIGDVTLLRVTASPAAAVCVPLPCALSRGHTAVTRRRRSRLSLQHTRSLGPGTRVW